MITINLMGFGSDRPAQVVLQAQTYKEALEGLKNHPCFDPRKTDDRFVCRVPGVDTTLDLAEPVRGDHMEIHCEDRFKTNQRRLTGAGGDNAFVKILVGVILITVGVVTGGLGAAAGAMVMSGALGFVSTVLITTGLAFIAGGLAMMLAPDIDDSDSDKSRVAGKYPNTVKAGTTKALILGRHRWGGHLFSVNLEGINREDAPLRSFTTLTMGQYNTLESRNRRDSWETLYFSMQRGVQEQGGAFWDGNDSFTYKGDLPTSPWQIL